MRSIREGALVTARVRKYTETYPKFEAYFDDIKYRLALDPEILDRIGTRINEADDPIYVIETAVMRSLGIPRIRMLVSVNETTIEINSFAVYETK